MAPFVRGATWIRWLILAACVAAVTWTVIALEPARVMAVVRDADPFWLGISIAPVVGRYLIWGLKWTIMMRRHGPIAYLTTLACLLSGVFVNLTTPTAKLAGGVLRGFLVHRATGWGMAVSYGWSVADQVTNVLGNLALGGLVALIAIPTLPTGPTRDVFLAAGISALAIVLALILLRGWSARQIARPGLARRLARFTPERFRTTGPGGPSAGWVDPVFRPLLRVGATWKVAPVDLSLAALSWGSMCLANALTLKALGVEVAPFQAAFALILAAFAGTVTGVAGGIAATEGALIAIYTTLGIPPVAAAAAALAHRAVYYAVSLAAGGVALFATGPWRREGSSEG